MHSRLLFALAAAAAVLPQAASAQADTRIYRAEPGRAYSFSFNDDDENRAVIGITTSTGSARDTLGVLVSSIASGGPAEKAGLEEGNRIASINGVNLKLSPADVGDWDMSSAMSRRLTRELGKVKAGGDVELRVYSSGQTRAVKIKTVAYDSLYRNARRWRDDGENRAALGVSLGSSGSRRDTLGVLVMWVDDEGPAVKAGIEEGNRITAINNVDLRVSRDDAGDEMISSAKVQRLQRELEKLKPGDEVELRVYGDGKTRTVKVKTVALSTLSRGRHSMIFGEGQAIAMPRIAPMPSVPPMPPMGFGPRMRITRITM
jgi:S1-C subfamily serine protease